MAASEVNSNATPMEKAIIWDVVLSKMQTFFDTLLPLKSQECILILGDRNDVQDYELSRFLRRDNTPVVKSKLDVQYPRFDKDNATDIVLIDFPMYDEFHNITTDIMFAFIEKLIFDEALRLKILLVVPDYFNAQSFRFSKIVSKLVAVLDHNSPSYFNSIGVIGAIRQGNQKITEKKVLNIARSMIKDLQSDNMEDLHDILYKLTDPDLKIYGEGTSEFLERRKTLMSKILENDAFAIFRRRRKRDKSWAPVNEGRRLRGLVFEKLSYASPDVKVHYRVVVDKITYHFVSQSLEFTHDKDYVKSLAIKVAKYVVAKDFDDCDRHSVDNNPYHRYIEMIVVMSHEEFGDYMDNNGGHGWKDLQFERTKLDFFEKLLDVPSSVTEFNMRLLIVNEIYEIRKKGVKWSKNC
ncbi:Hypothetical predicted protein [Cloeon dipterum]|nr:Hypothetical predicted protein [Cloeon dipterum]